MPENDKQVGGKHYARKIPHWDYAAQLPYLDGQVSKYVDRHAAKGGFQDLLKAEHYLHKLMETAYPEEYAEYLKAKVTSVEIVNITPSKIELEPGRLYPVRKDALGHEWVKIVPGNTYETCILCERSTMYANSEMPCPGKKK